MDTEVIFDCDYDRESLTSLTEDVAKKIETIKKRGTYNVVVVFIPDDDDEE